LLSPKDIIDQFIDDMLFNPLNFIDRNPSNVIFTKHGRISQRKRFNYVRGAKRQKHVNPWESVEWLLLIRHPEVGNPSHSKGKDFRRTFRIPYPVFERIVRMLFWNSKVTISVVKVSYESPKSRRRG